MPQQKYRPAAGNIYSKLKIVPIAIAAPAF
jgi:hypothetical protein